MLSEVSLRLAIAEDLESIQRIYSYVIGPPTGQERTWSRLISDGCMVVAAVEGEIAGFGGIDPNAVEQLKWLYVMPEFQGSGVGTEILKRLEEIGWARGLSAIRLHAAPGAFQFYQRHGYREVERDDVSHDHDGIAMIKGICP